MVPSGRPPPGSALGRVHPPRRGEGRAPRLGVGVVLAAVLAASTARAEPSVAILPLGFEATDFRAPESRLASVIASTEALRADRSLAGQPLAVVWGAGGGAALALVGGKVAILPLGGVRADLATLERAPDSIPGSRLAAAGPLSVALTGPTSAYPHDALGSAIHARAITIRERGRVPPEAGAKVVPIELTRLEAGPGAVFEDREPRIADLDGDGAAEIVTIKSYAERGSAMVVLAKSGGAWRVAAETPPIGTPQRWLNPAAIADFLGTGRAQVAIVRTPHADGVLQLWTWEGGRLSLRAEAAGYSDHAFGQTAQALAATIVRAGRRELAIPTLDRRALAILSFGDGIRETARMPLPARIATGLAALGSGADLHLLAGLEDGRVADIRP